MFEEERMLLNKSSNEFGHALDQWAIADADGDHNTDFYKKATEDLYHMILRLRSKGRIKGNLINIDLEARIEELVREKAGLEEEIKGHKESGLKALNLLKEQDRTIAMLEAQIFHLKQR